MIAPESGRVAAEPATPSNFLARLAPGDRDDLIGIAQSAAHAKNEYVFRVGEAGRRVYFLDAGRVKIHQASPDGREIILWFCLPGEVFGIAEVARGGDRVVAAVACEPSRILSISQEQFKTYLATHPSAALVTIEVLSARLRVLSDVLVNLVTDDVPTRTAKLILRLASRYGIRDGKEMYLSIPLTHQEIADMVGTTRQTVTAVLGDLRRQGVLSIENHRIRIAAEDGLEERSMGRHP
jgi:CRP/FNR family transcriptional regulator